MLLLAALCTAATTHAYDFQSGDLYYNINSDNTVEVTYQEYHDYDSHNYQGLTTATIPATVTYDGTTYSVTSIGEYAFRSSSSLTSLTIPNSVTSIGYAAFEDCSSLTSISLPNSVTSIEDCVFRYCSSLTSVTIPNSVTSIGQSAFYSCRSLTSLTIPNSITCIKYEAFCGCSSLTSITIPNSVTSIGGFAFCGCSALTSITLPNSVTSIEYEAFKGCSSLTSITLPNSVTSIEGSAFSGCTSLTSITIPNSVTSIGYEAFKGCSSLTKTIYTGDFASWCATSFSDVYSNPTFYSHNLYINDVEVKDLVTFPETVTSIGDYAFVGCTFITSLSIPKSVTSIGSNAFNGSRLGDIYCYATTPPMCNNNTFDGVSKNCYIHVPAGTVRDYQLATGWSDFYYYYEIEEETALSETEQQNKPSRKILRDGQVLILRNGVTYDMMGNTL